MTDIEDKTRQPSVEELCQYVGNPLFDELCAEMEREYAAVKSVEYSGDKILLGWNLKFKKAGRTLCTVYPRKGHFPMLLIVGRKEKERTEALLPSLSEEFQSIYSATQEGMGQRWLLLEFSTRTQLYDDALKIIRLRRTPPKK